MSTLFRYHVEYYDPFPHLRVFHTSSRDEVFELLEKYGHVRVYLAESARNCKDCMS